MKRKSLIVLSAAVAATLACSEARANAYAPGPNSPTEYVQQRDLTVDGKHYVEIFRTRVAPLPLALRPAVHAVTIARKASDFGALPNDGKDDRAALSAALAAGDVILEAGQYDISGDDFAMPDNRQLVGAANLASKLVFKTSKTGYAVKLGSANITIDGVDIKANDGVFRTSGSTIGINITHCSFQWGYDGTYYNRKVVYAPGSNRSMKIEYNNFHDSENSDRNVDLYDMTDSSYSYNNFLNVHDGGHLDGTTTNFKFVGNRGKGIQRMGLELQDHNSLTSSGILVEGNVFTEWRSPDNWSFGLSIIPQRAKNVVVRNNYMSSGNAPLSGGTHLGYGIETGFQPEGSIVEGNVLVGNWVEAIVTSIKNVGFKNNKSYGNNQWGAFSGEPGLDGNGSILDLGGNAGPLPIGQAPPPPPPSGGTGDTTQPVYTVSARDLGSGVAEITVSAPADVVVVFTATGNSQDLGSVTGHGTFRVKGLPTNWEVKVSTTGGSTTFHTTGPSVYPWTGKVAKDTGTIPNDPPPATQPAFKGVHVDIEIGEDGKVKSATTRPSTGQ